MSALIRNIRYTALEQAVLATHVVVSVALIRYLGPEQYGTYSFYLTLSAFSSVLTFGALETLYVRDVARHGDEGGTHTGALVALTLGGTLLSWVALAVYWFAERDNPRLSFLLLALTALTQLICFRNTFRSYFIARQAVPLAVMLNLGVYVFGVSLKVGGIVARQPLEYFFVLMVVEALAGGVVFGIAYRRTSGLRFEGAPQLIASMFRRGWPLVFASLAGFVILRVDQIMLFYMTSERELGRYASMMWLIEKTFVFIGIVMTAFFPYLAEKYRSDREQYHRAVRIGHKLFSIVVFPLVVFLVANHAAVIRVLFGEEFAVDSHALSYLALALLFIFWGAINQKVLVVTNALKLDLFFAGSSAAVGVVLNFLLIPRYGIAGAAAAWLGAHSFYFWAQFFISGYRAYNAYMLAGLPVPLAMSLVCLAASRLVEGVIPQTLLYFSCYFVFLAAVVRVPVSEEYGTLGRLFLTKMVGLGRAGS
jgi:O-antigen/teichoic acid export membrane protein